VLGMEQLVDEIEEHQSAPVVGLKVLDIGCNDGSLLDVFRRRGAITTGIEPTDAAHDAAAKGHGIDNAYLDFAEAFRYVKTYGHPDIITFVNVFAHITGLRSVLGALEIIRGENTMFVIENHYLGSVIAGNQFDTFYHEHPRTYSFSSFARIAKTMGMHVAKVQYPKRYAGNIRVFLKPGRPDWGRNPYNNDETHFGSKLSALDEKVQEWRVRKGRDLRYRAPLAAAGFPGRAAVIIGILGLDEIDITAVYENPVSKKVGHYVPGTRIPIKSDAEFPWAQYDGPVLNLAWHIADEIEHNWRAKGFKGTFIQAIEAKDFA